MKEILSKLNDAHVLIITILCYAAGFVILNIYLASYGIYETSFFAFGYIKTTFCFILFFALPLWISYEILLSIYQKGNIITSDKIVISGWKQKINAFIFLPFSIVIFNYLTFFLPIIIFALVFQKKSYGISIILMYNSIIITLLATILIFSETMIYLKKKSVMSMSFVYPTLLIFAGIFVFSLSSYKYIPNSLGGGHYFFLKSFLVKKDKSNTLDSLGIFIDKTYSTQPLNIIYENDKTIYFSLTDSVSISTTPAKVKSQILKKTLRSRVIGLNRDLIDGEIILQNN